MSFKQFRNKYKYTIDHLLGLIPEQPLTLLVNVVGNANVVHTRQST
jgi:hypothetical protein